MEITFYSETIAKDWDDFVMRNDNAWFWHTTDWLLYCLNSQFGVTTVNKSFCLRENKKIVAIVPLIVEKKVVKGKEFKQF